MFCPNCGNEINENQKFCTKCGYKIEKKEEKINTENKETKKSFIDKKIIFFALGVFALCFIIITLILHYVGNVQGTDLLTEIPQSDNEEISKDLEEIKEQDIIKMAEPCDSKITVDNLINTFKNSNIYYKAIMQNTISSVDVQNIVTNQYDNINDIYSCSADVVIKSNKFFKPKTFETSNEYYYYAQNTFTLDDENVEGYLKYTQYTYPIKYYSQLANDNSIVTVPSEENKTMGEFICEGNCKNKDSFIILPDEQKRLNQLKKEKEVQQKSIQQQEQNITPITPVIIPNPDKKSSNMPKSSIPSSRYVNTGAPGPDISNKTSGIDTTKEVDFGPYMQELQRRIKMNWKPPKGNESKRVILLFKVNKDGSLSSVSVDKSSGNTEVDNAAIKAVKISAPFKPLPKEYKENNVDINFTFDYNVKHSGY